MQLFYKPVLYIKKKKKNVKSGWFFFILLMNYISEKEKEKNKNKKNPQKHTSWWKNIDKTS